MPSFLSGITGSFSTPAGDNPTVAIVEAAYRHHGLDVRYLNCEVQPEVLGDAVRGARAMGWIGFNCSLPHKVAVIRHLDELGTSAELIGAVNCVVRRGERLVGENTDGQGFAASLRTVVDPAGQEVMVLGAGGAARAIAVEVALAGARSVTVVNRDPGRGEGLAELIEQRTPAVGRFVPWKGSATVPEEVGVLVNATSVGLAPDVTRPPDVVADSLLPGLVVADVIPNPARTALLQEAGRRGAVTLDGVGMLVNQAVIAIELWTGVAAEPGVLRSAYAEAVGT
jgi:shikimate dehydrogenase